MKRKVAPVAIVEHKIVTGPTVACVGMQSPWGRVDHVKAIIAGVWQVSTSSHGGIFVEPNRNAQIPVDLRRIGGWYEEDCEWCIPFCVFEAQIKADCWDEYVRSQLPQKDHWRTLKQWFPDIYERFTGKTLQPGESHTRDRQVWNKEHRADLIVVSAVGDWHENVPKGMVGVTACVGGRNEHGGYAGALRTFLVPGDEYQTRLKNPGGSFIVDPSRHQEFRFRGE